MFATSADDTLDEEGLPDDDEAAGGSGGLADILDRSRWQVGKSVMRQWPEAARAIPAAAEPPWKRTRGSTVASSSSRTLAKSALPDMVNELRPRSRWGVDTPKCAAGASRARGADGHPHGL